MFFGGGHGSFVRYTGGGRVAIDYYGNKAVFST